MAVSVPRLVVPAVVVVDMPCQAPATSFPRLVKTLVVAPVPLAPTTMSAKPSPVTSPTATEVAPVVVRVVVVVAKVTVAGATVGVVVAAVPPVTRWTSVEPACVTMTSRRPSRSRSARATATAAPAHVLAAVALNAPGPVPRKSEVPAVVPRRRSSCPSPLTSPVAMPVTDDAVGSPPPAGTPP